MKKHKDIIVGIKKCHFPSKIERTFKNAHLKVLFMSANKVHCNKMLISNKMFVLNKIFVFNKFILTVDSIMIKNDAARKKCF